MNAKDARMDAPIDGAARPVKAPTLLQAVVAAERLRRNYIAHLTAVMADESQAAVMWSESPRPEHVIARYVLAVNAKEAAQ